MLYKVYKEKDIGGAETTFSECIDTCEVQKQLVDAGYKIRFEGTSAEYEAVKTRLTSKVKVVLTDARTGPPKPAKKASAPVKITEKAALAKTNTRQKRAVFSKDEDIALTLENFANPVPSRRSPRTRKKNIDAGI